VARGGRLGPAGKRHPLELVGARRPTVTTALTHLAERGELIHRDDATWLLTDQPVGIPTAQVARVIEHRRRAVPSEPSNGRKPQAAVHSPADADELRERRAARSGDPLTQAASG
jgi:hypothetical protein